ncbi:MAG: hypothetical protein DBX55_07090 [Verrucomicrobia bacterium]|nr:MAG: hypothetical protein DBX55_07090 [Verrucomicrobiota bacterium]
MRNTPGGQYCGRLQQIGILISARRFSSQFFIPIRRGAICLATFFWGVLGEHFFRGGRFRAGRGGTRAIGLARPRFCISHQRA